MEPLVIVVTRHVCPHCHRGRSTRAAAVAHIARCWRSPDVRGCKTCAHHEPATVDVCYPDASIDEGCGAGIDLSGGLVTGCPAWQEVPGC